MPCNDVTELIQVVLDERDQLAGYRFIKRTCGRGVGAKALLMPELGGRTADAILAMDPEAFIGQHPGESELEDFLRLKHLVSVQAALAVLTGRQNGGPACVCNALDVAQEEGNTVFDARIRVDLLTQEIPPCGRCKTCAGAAS